MLISALVLSASYAAAGDAVVDAGEPAHQLTWPMDGRLIWQIWRENAEGIRIEAPTNSVVRAALDGVVVHAGPELKSFGNLIILRHQDDLTTVYAFLGRIDVSRRDKVSRGQVIGRSGLAPNRLPQILFSVRRDGKSIDPVTLLPTR
jgi:murein DD-endopeptidase MepM/ murein hydrolase activator NlpD